MIILLYIGIPCGKNASVKLQIDMQEVSQQWEQNLFRTQPLSLMFKPHIDWKSRKNKLENYENKQINKKKSHSEGVLFSLLPSFQLVNMKLKLTINRHAPIAQKKYWGNQIYKNA